MIEAGSLWIQVQPQPLDDDPVMVVAADEATVTTDGHDRPLSLAYFAERFVPWSDPNAPCRAGTCGCKPGAHPELTHRIERDRRRAALLADIGKAPK